MSISARLKYIADLVSEGYTVADIGTDHGYVPLYLLRQGRVPRAIAADLSSGALRKAMENADRFGLSDKMDCRLSDGLQSISPGEADCIVISGMGGILMRKILDAGLDTVLSAKELVLSPHRNPELIIEFLQENQFNIICDATITDKGKSYRVFKAVPYRL